MKMANLKSMHSSAKERRKRVIEQREAQLKSGKKPYKPGRDPQIRGEDGKVLDTAELTAKDRERINKEIETLKTRI